eukprot:685962_1
MKQKTKEKQKDETIESLNMKLMQIEETSENQIKQIQISKNDEIEALKNENYRLRQQLKGDDVDNQNDPDYIPHAESNYSDDIKLDYIHMSSFTSPRNCTKIVSQSAGLANKPRHKSARPSRSSIQNGGKHIHNHSVICKLQVTYTQDTLQASIRH